MPLLPSGKMITLVPQIRLLNAIQSAPEPGKFWVETHAALADYEALPGIGVEGRTVKQVPLPKSMEDFCQYVTVVVTLEPDGQEIGKYPLKDFPPKGLLSEDEETLWVNWMGSPPVQLFLEMQMQECFDQVEFFNNLQDRGLADYSGGFDFFLEREPLEDKKQRHIRYLRRAQDYLARLESMRITEPIVQVTWVDVILEHIEFLKAWKDGESFFQQKAAQYPQQIEFQIAALICKMEQNKYGEVEKYLWEAVKQNPERPEYWNLLVQVYLNQQAYAKALEITNMAISIHPENRDLQEKKFVCETAIRKTGIK